MISQDNTFILQPTALCFDTYGTGATINVGQEFIDAISYTGASITSPIGAVTDISDPAGTGGWTDLVDISGGPVNVQLVEVDAHLLKIAVAAAEDSGDALRVQVLIDGVVVGDAQVIADNAGVHYAFHKPVLLTDTNVSKEYPCNASFKIRAARVGTFTEATSYIKVGGIVYEYVKKI